MATPAENRAAQRRIARQIKEGTYQKSNIGKKARKVATDLEREPLAHAALAHAIRILEPSGATASPVNRDRLERNILGDELLAKSMGKAEFLATVGLLRPKLFPGASIRDLQDMLSMDAEGWKDRARQDALAGKKTSIFYYK
jgi:hypothetical protein